MRLSRRSTYLLLFGVAWIIYGLAVHDAPQAVSIPLYATVPTAWQGWAWVAAGVVGIATVIMPWHRARTVGFTAVIIPPTLWFFGFGALWVNSPAHPEIAWQGAVIWGVLALLALVCSGDEDVSGR